MTTHAYSAPMEESAAETLRVRIGALLFMAISLYFWISLNPFVDRSDLTLLDPNLKQSSQLNQFVLIFLFIAVSAYGFLHPLRNAILQPRALLAILFLWLSCTSAISAHPSAGFKSIILALMASVIACIYVLLPSSERNFAKMLGIGVVVMLLVAYFGVFFKPDVAIHQANDVVEQVHAGLWRGHFRHKNIASAAMVLAAFFGLYVASVWSRFVGAAIFLLSFIFLANTGGKTSIAMLPGILFLAWVFERFRFLRVLLVVGGLLAFNLFAVGSAVFTQVGDFVSSLGIDATFTNRADVWRFTFAAIAEHPFTGYGMKAFWQTAELVYSGNSIETWAVTAAHAHNSYLDVLLAAGFPGLLLTLLWIIYLPLRDLSRLGPQRERSPLTRLFVRIWLYTIFSACLESFFFEGGNSLWFTFLFSIYGLRLQSTDVLIEGGRKVANAQ